jgi:hypothetical protein
MGIPDLLLSLARSRFENSFRRQSAKRFPNTTFMSVALKHPSLEQRVAWLETQAQAQSRKIRKLEQATGQLSLFDQSEVA